MKAQRRRVKRSPACVRVRACLRVRACVCVCVSARACARALISPHSGEDGWWQKELQDLDGRGTIFIEGEESVYGTDAVRTMKFDEGTGDARRTRGEAGRDSAVRRLMSSVHCARVATHRWVRYFSMARARVRSRSCKIGRRVRQGTRGRRL